MFIVDVFFTPNVYIGSFQHSWSVAGVAELPRLLVGSRKLFNVHSDEHITWKWSSPPMCKDTVVTQGAMFHFHV